MLLGEELVLLLLDDDKGTWLVRRRAVPRAVRVALLVELLARRRIALDDHGIIVEGLPATSGGDEVLERAARAMVGHRVVEALEPGRGELPALLTRLRQRGVLRRGLLRRRRHLPRDHHPEAAVRARLREALQVQLRPDRHTAMLVALVFELGLIEALFPGQDSLPLSMRAATITSQLREDQHYFPTTLEADAEAQERAALDPGAVLDGLGVAFEALEVVGALVELAALPLKVVGKILEDLP